jgi:hypothetical protein
LCLFHCFMPSQWIELCFVAFVFLVNRHNSPPNPGPKISGLHLKSRLDIQARLGLGFTYGHFKEEARPVGLSGFFVRKGLAMPAGSIFLVVACSWSSLCPPPLVCWENRRSYPPDHARAAPQCRYLFLRRRLGYLGRGQRDI